MQLHYMYVFTDVPLLKRSLDLFNELNDFYISELRHTLDRDDGIGRTDALLYMCGGAMIGKPDSELVSGTLLAAKEHTLPHKVYNAAQMRELYPTFHLSEDEVAVHEDSAGYLMAELCVESYIALARKHGAELHFEEPMLDWKPCLLSIADDGGNGGNGEGGSGTSEGVEVRTARCVYRAKKLVLSVGAWAPSIYGDAIPQLPLTIERRVLFWFQCDEDKIPEFAVSGLPHYHMPFLAMTDLLSLFCVILSIRRCPFLAGKWRKDLSTAFLRSHHCQDR